MHKCKKCGCLKEDKEFNKHKGMASGYLNTCKECEHKYYKERYVPAVRKERKWTNDYRTAWHKEYSEKNKEKLRVKSLEYYCKNKEKQNERARKWAKDNKDKRKKTQLEWQRKNKDKIRVYTEKTNNGEYSHKLKEENVCENCGTDTDLCTHHKDNNGSRLPRKERNNVLNNLSILCRSCHAKLHRAENKLTF